MADRSAEQLEAESASLLQEFGFTEYESYTFVYLLRLGGGTAKDVAALGHIPRTRVYDAVEALHEAGLVDIKYDSPQEYTPVSRETAVRSLDLQRQNTIAELAELFAELEPVEDHSEEFGVWTVTGREAVASRALEFVDDADDEIVLMTVDELLSDDHLARLEAATERGVDVHIGGVSPTVRERIEHRIPSATFFETLWEWSEVGAGSVLVTDERTALVSVLLDDETQEGPNETAIWGTGERNSLVVVLRAIFTYRLHDDDDGDDDPAPGSS